MSNEGVDLRKRRFLTLTTAAVGAVGTGFAAWPFLSAWQPSAKARALGAPTKADISSLQEGQMVIFEWRGSPVWVIKRSPEMLATLDAVKDDVADPESEYDQQPEYAKNKTRSLKPEVLVMIGTCTHLGCSPKFRPDFPAPEIDAQWKGGFFCPCHGSKFDLAGRVYKGVPAPVNLKIPPYRFESETMIVIGEDPTDQQEQKGTA